MTIEFQNTKEDLKRVNQLLFLNRFKKGIRLMVLLLILLLLIADELYNERAYILMEILLYSIIVPFAFYFVPFLMAQSALNKLILKNPSALDGKKISVTEDGLQVVRGEKQSVLLWTGIASVQLISEFIYLLHADNTFGVIPVKAFADGAEATNFVGLIQSKITQTKDAALNDSAIAANKSSYSTTEFQNTKADYKRYYKLNNSNFFKVLTGLFIIASLGVGIVYGGHAGWNKLLIETTLLLLVISTIIDFFSSDLSDKFRLLILMLISVVPIIVAFVSKLPTDWKGFLTGTLLSAIAIPLFYYFIPYWSSLLKLNKTISKQPASLDKKLCLIVEDGLQVVASEKQTTWKWTSIASILSSGEFITVFLIDKSTILIPRKAFLNENNATNFVGIVKNKIVKAPKKNVTAQKIIVNRPPYLLGLLGLMPLVGGFVGIGLMLYGIFKYKDKWLTIIGAVDVLITVGVYSYLFFQLNNMNFAKDWVKISQSQLNTLMQDVEFYKLQNGAYPDSLEQIRKNGGMEWIEDPIQMWNKDKKDKKFQYKKVGKNYYLFSAGVDGVPYTKDDIYPSIANSDSVKFGLIRK